MKKKFVFMFVILLNCVCTTLAQSEYYFSDGDFSYITSNNAGGNCTLRGYSGSGGAINIPGTVSTTMGGFPVTYSVTQVGQNTDYANPVFGNNVTSITIPVTVTMLNMRAFDGCTSLSSINIPNSVTSIGPLVFNNCTSLKSITIPNSVTSIGDGAFSGCTGLTSLVIPDLVTRIGSSAFRNCTSLTTINIPNLVTTLGGTFSGCTSLKSITIPNSVTSIDGAFQDCTSLTSVSIPNSVTSLNAAFSGCKGLLSASIPQSVETIGWEAFKDCSSLTSIAIPNSVTELMGYAFAGCTSLASVIIPSSIKSFGYLVFDNCTSLKDVTVAWETPLSIGDLHFSNNLYSIINNTKLHVPCGTKSDYEKANVWRSFGTISDGCTYDFTIEVSTTSLNFVAAGEEKTFTLFSNGSWTVESDEPWLTIIPNSGTGSLLGTNETITVAATANTEPSQRTATIQATLHVFGATTKILISVTQATTGKPGDINGDDAVNGADMNILLTNFGKSGPTVNPAADLNSDGSVNGADMNILLTNFGK